MSAGNKENSAKKTCLPGLQWDVTVEDPAVLQLDGLWGGRPIASARGRGMNGVASSSQGVSVQTIGRLVGQSLVVVRWGQWRPMSGLIVVVGSPCR